MPDITRIGNIEFSDGPDRLRGGSSCHDQHINSEREGHPDHCCCCDPCRYIRPRTQDIMWLCCRCVPRMICIKFIPDATTLDCCRPIVLPVFVQFNPGAEGTFGTIDYAGTISDIDVALSIIKDPADGLCYWRVQIADPYITSRIAVDHNSVSCLSVPDIEVTGLTDVNGCVGKITFSDYEAIKIPFQHAIPDDPAIEMEPTNDPDCACTEVPKYLCVHGQRHWNGEGDTENKVEFVRFTWDGNDAWRYLPCHGNVNLDREAIYLRCDHYGNPYLELDFEQTGSNTNDWADPPNTQGVDRHEIRDGMIPLETCGCKIFAHSVSGDGHKFVYISAGNATNVCGCWKYLCGKCRCASKWICVIGEIDGNHIDTQAQWDGTGWQCDGGEYTGPFHINLVADECDECILTVTGDFSAPFLPSTPIECGEFMKAELESGYAPESPLNYNWLWLQASPCECFVSMCGPCKTERCGGPPRTLYYEIFGRTNFLGMPGGYAADETCDITVVLNYFQRWYNVSDPPRITCGYIGYTTVNCPQIGVPGDPDYEPATNRVIRVSAADDGFGVMIYQVDRAELSGTPGPLVWVSLIAPGLFPPAQSCDPYLAVVDWNNQTVHPWWACCQTGVEYKIVVSE